MPNPAAAPDSDMREALDDYYHLKAINEADDAENKVREPLLRCRDPVVCQNSAELKRVQLRMLRTLRGDRHRPNIAGLRLGL